MCTYSQLLLTVSTHSTPTRTRFHELLASDESVVEILLAPGQVVGVDNRRVLHARTDFVGHERHLQGCYIDL